MYFTKTIEANHGAYGVQLQQNLRTCVHDWDVSARASFTSLFGPEDVDVNVYGAELVTSWKQWQYRRVTMVPSAGLASYVASSHEEPAAVDLDDERVISAMATVGAALQFSVARLAAGAGMSRLPSLSMKFGIGR